MLPKDGKGSQKITKVDPTTVAANAKISIRESLVFHGRVGRSHVSRKGVSTRTESALLIQRETQTYETARIVTTWSASREKVATVELMIVEMNEAIIMKVMVSFSRSNDR